MIVALAAAPAHSALPGFTGGDPKSILEACAAERAPLIDRQKQYAAVKREKMTAAAMASAKVGAKVLLSSGLIGMVLGAGTVGILSKALTMRSGNQTNSRQQDDADMAHAFQAVSVVVAIGGAVNEYVKVKQQQFRNDAREISKSIDADADLQMSVGEQTSKEMAALADCRGSQVADYNAKYGGAANDRDRKEIAKGQAGLRAALKSDLEITEDVAAQQATMVKTFALARAMADAKSEADVLEAEAPAAGGQASRVVMQLPPLESLPGQPAPASPAPEVQKVSYVTVRATRALAAPDARAGVVMNFPAGRLVTPKGRAKGDATWWEIEVAGTPGFIRGADLADASAPAPAPAKTPASAKGRAAAKAAPPPPPPPPPPNPVRDLNRLVLAAKTGGVERLKSLSAQIQPVADAQASPQRAS